MPNRHARHSAMTGNARHTTRNTLSRVCTSLTRAWLRGPVPPNPRASMAVASVVERRMDNTSSAKVCGKNARILLSSPKPRERRDAVNAAQSSCRTENRRMPAKPPYTKRSEQSAGSG